MERTECDYLKKKFFFSCGPLLRTLLNFLEYCFCFMVWYTGHEACGILPPRQGSNPHLQLWKVKSWPLDCLGSPHDYLLIILDFLPPAYNRIISSIQFSRLVMSDSLRPHESQHPRPPCPSPTPGFHSDSRPSSQ